MSLPDRFLRHLRSLGVGREPEHLLVAVSGGCDSLALLYLLRFHAREMPLTLTVAHLDHAMREGSDADARWLAGVCAAWRVPLVRRRLERAPVGEAGARAARYAFLRESADAVGAGRILTAHQADDQAETVLFRVLRGTGLAGLRGIPARTASGLLRPLLPFWRDELEDFAASAGLRWRTDPTNRESGPVRNRLRRLLPSIEREMVPGARRNLVSLAALAADAEAGMARSAALARRSLVRREGGALVLARAGLRDYDSAIGARILRQMLRRFGVVLDRTGTRTALQFITDAPSGRELQLPGRLRIRLEFGEARFERHRDSPPDRPLRIPALAAGEAGRGRLRVGGRAYRAAWRMEGEGSGEGGGAARAAIDPAAVRFPLLVRGWAPGDRVRTPGGTKTLKKLFGERRVRRGERSRLPVLVDDRGQVLWVAGLDRVGPPAPERGRATLYLTLADVRFQADPGADRGA